MPNIHIRVPEGTAPFTFTVRDASGNQLYSRTSSKREEVFNYAGGAYSYTVNDSNGKTFERTVDAISANLSGLYLKRLSITFDSATGYANTMKRIKAENPSFNGIGVSIQAWDYFKTQADWENPAWTQRFDHTQERGDDPDENSFTVKWDKIVYAARKTGMKLQVGVNPFMTYGYLKEDGYSFRYGYQDLQRNVDGQPRRVTNQSIFFFTQQPSYASDVAKTYSAQLLAKFCYRYQPAINDGTIISINFWFTDNGEAEVDSTTKFDNAPDGLNYGDFSDVMRTKFAEFYIQKMGTLQNFNQKMGTSLTALNKEQLQPNLLLNGPENLQKHYMWFQMKCLSDFEIYMQEYAYTQANLNRSKLWVLDVGSIFDGNIYRRKTLNINARLKAGKRWLYVKSNNGPDQGEYAPEQITGAARYAGATGVWEPSPLLEYFTVEVLRDAVNLGFNKGANLSAFLPNNPNNPGEVDYGWNLWKNVAQQAMVGKPNNLPAVDDAINGQLVECRLMFKDVVLYGKGDHIGDSLIKQGWQTIKNANPTKDINIIIDDSDIYADFINQ